MANDDQPIYEDGGSLAPLVYFDFAVAHGTLNGAIQIEVASRILIPSFPDGGVSTKLITSGRLRCSPTAAFTLREALDAALKMLDHPQQNSVAAAKLN